MRLKIRRPKELKAFNSLRLPIEDTAEAATEILTEVLVELASETKLTRTEPKAQVEIRQLEVQIKIQQLKELKVLLIAIHC